MFETFSNLEEEKLSPLQGSHVEGGRADPPEDGHPRRPEEAELDQRGVLREAQADVELGQAVRLVHLGLRLDGLPAVLLETWRVQC